MRSVPFSNLAERLVPRRAPSTARDGEPLDLVWRRSGESWWTFYSGQQLQLVEPAKSDCWF